MRPVLQVRLLGNFQLQWAGQTLTALFPPRLQNLLAFLILHRDAPISRQQLADRFWPDSTEEQARTNLRNLIHQLRQALPALDDYVQSDTHSLAWREESAWELDVASFENCLSVRTGQPVQRDMLEQAVQVYTGDLLPGSYDDWIEPFRSRLRQAFLFTLESLAVITEEERNLTSALEYARRLVAADPLHTGANSQIIRLHMLLGNRVEAVKAYKEYAQSLWQELKIEPDEEFKELFHRLQSTHEPAISFNTGTRLVGRNREWHELLSTWKKASAGHAHMLFISGEAGIGKTRLVEELTGWANVQGILTATSYCYPAEGNLPYAPIASWLRARPLPHLDKVWLAEIARLLPEVHQLRSGLPKVEPIREAWQRQHLFDALAHAVSDRKQAQLLVIEDIHWCDQDTLEWLHYLLRFAPQALLLIAATVRSGQAEVEHPLHRLQSTLRSAGKFEELILGPLSEVETVELANHTHQQVFGQKLNPEDAQHVFQEAEGNPLFAIEMIRLGSKRPSLSPPGGDWLEASERIEGVLSQRISQVSPETREILCMAATIGREFSLDVLRMATHQSDDKIVLALDELLQRQIIREISPDSTGTTATTLSPESYDFTHDLLRQAGLAGMSKAHLRLLHRRVAEAIQVLDRTAQNPHHAEVASHYERAGLSLQAIRSYRLAAETSASIFANADAIRYISRAIEMAEDSGVGISQGISPDEYAQMLETAGDLLALDGKYPQAQNCFERALAQSNSGSQIWRSQIYQKISDGLVPQSQHALAEGALEQAEQALSFNQETGSLEEQQEWLQIQLARVQLSYWQSSPDKMEAIIRQIEPDVATHGRIDQQITLLSLQIMVRMKRERYRLSAETVEIGRRRIELAEKYCGTFDLAVARFQYGFALLWHGGDLRAARECLAHGLEATTRIGARIWQVRSLAYLSIANRKLGNLEEVREQSQQLLSLCRGIDDHTYYGMGLVNQGWLAWRTGDFERASSLCNEAHQIWEKVGDNVFRSLGYWVLLAIAVEQCNIPQAVEHAQVLLDPNPYYQPVPAKTGELLQLALSAFQSQDQAAALELFRQAIQEARASREL